MPALGIFSVLFARWAVHVQDSGQTDGSGEVPDGRHQQMQAQHHTHQRLRSNSSHSQQPDSPQPAQSGYTRMTSDAGASSSGAAALAAAQAQVTGTDLRHAAELWQRQHRALESAGDLPSLASGEGNQVIIQYHVCPSCRILAALHGNKLWQV